MQDSYPGEYGYATVNVRGLKLYSKTVDSDVVFSRQVVSEYHNAKCLFLINADWLHFDFFPSALPMFFQTYHF